MKPKPIVRLFIILVVASLSLVLYASYKKPLQAVCREKVNKECELITEKISTNDYIFFESLSKFLSISISR
jgi:hypothetical protein